MLKVAVLSNSMSAGGAERVANLLVKHLLEKNIDVSQIVVNESAPDVIRLTSQIYSLERNSKAKFFTNLKTARNFIKVTRQIQPNVLIVNCEFPELLACFAPKSIRVIAIEHTSTPWAFFPLLGKVVRGVLRLKSCQWVSVAPQTLIWPYRQKPVHIPNYFLAANRESEVFVGNQIRRLVFIGRLEPEKSPEFFLKLCKASDISGLVMGTGSLEQELRILCQELKIEVEFLGFVEYPWGKCLEGDLVIVPSKWEGDGLVIVEALHLGLPILLADIPDLRRFGLPDQNYFPMKNSIQENHSQLVWQIEALGTHLLSLVPDEECRNRVLAERNPELITKKWIDLLTV